jgi:pantothenate synthetase
MRQVPTSNVPPFVFLHIVSADPGYFDQKDRQQLAPRLGMVSAFLVPSTTVACATLREAAHLK